MKKFYILFALPFFTLITGIYADRWLVLPPRIEPPATTDWSAGDWARAMALYLRASRVSQIVSVAEAEACLKQENLDMAQKLAPEAISRVARACRAERILLTRIRRRSGEFELTSKVYFRESNTITDTLVKTGEELHQIIGEQLHERFATRPATPQLASYDLLVAGDTFGASYFDWQHFKKLFLSSDSVKSAYCMADATGTLQTYNLRSGKEHEKTFLDRLRFEGGFALLNPQAWAECVRKAQIVSQREGRQAIVILMVSAMPQDSEGQLQLKAKLRQIAQKSTMAIVVSSAASETVHNYWLKLARELGENVEYLPTAQRVRVGLANGQEWFVFRRAGRLYESRSAEPQRLEGGVIIPEKYAAMQSPQDLTKLYAQLSGNNVVSASDAISWNSGLIKQLSQAFRSTKKSPNWRVLLAQEGVNYYLSLTPNEARKLKVGDFARIYTELLPATGRDVLRNRPSPVLVIEGAYDSSPALEISVAEYLRNPARFLQKAIGGRSFYVMTGKVLSIVPLEEDALDDGF